MFQIEWQNDPPKQKDRTNASFKAIIITVALGSAFCILLATAIAISLPALTANQQKVFDTLLTGFTLGIGALIGLLRRNTAE
jgi:hypothetical protein